MTNYQKPIADPFQFDLETLPAPTLQSFVVSYEATAPPGIPLRNRQLFSWSWQASKRLLLAPLAKEQAHELFETNVLAILFNVMIDDLADLASGNSATLEQALRILDDGSMDGLEANEPFRRYLVLLAQLRQELSTRLSRSPAYRAWGHELLIFLGRFKEAMRRSSEWNRRWHGTSATGLRSTPDPMIAFDDFLDVMAPPIHSFVYGLLNLMQLDSGAHHQSSAILKILRCGEQFLAMSNWLATWRVELASGDFTSGVVVWALERRVILPDALICQTPAALIRTIEAGNFQSFIERAMAKRSAKLLDAGQGVTAFDVSAYQASLECVHSMHMNHQEVLKS